MAKVLLNTHPQPHQGRIWSVSWSPDSTRLVVSGTSEPTVWNVSHPNYTPFDRIGTLSTQESRVLIGQFFVDWSKHNNRIIVTHTGGLFQSWNGDSLNIINTNQSVQTVGLATNPIKANFATSAALGTLIWGDNLLLSLLPYQTQVGYLEPRSISALDSDLMVPLVLDWNYDGKRLAVGYISNNKVSIWDTDTGNILRSIQLENRPTDLSWNKDGKRLAVAVDNKIIIFNSDTGDPITTYVTQKAYDILGVDWNPTGTQLVYPNIQVGTTMPTIVTPPLPATASVTSLTLINADTDASIQTLTSGNTLNLGSLPTRNLNIRADASGSPAKVVFTLNGVPFREDTTMPFSFGDTAGNYAGWTPDVGSYTLTATPYNASNVPGTPLSVTFEVTDDER